LKLDHGVPRKKAGGRRCTEAFTHRGFFRPRKLYKKELFTHRKFYTKKPLLQVAFAHKRLGAFTHRSFYTTKSLHRGICYTQTRLHTEPFTHTRLLRNILSNYWCGMHRTCKNTSVKPDRNGLMIGSEKLCEEIFLRPCSKDLLVLMQLSQIAKTVQ
jgi:hypothetical protein